MVDLSKNPNNIIVLWSNDFPQTIKDQIRKIGIKVFDEMVKNGIDPHYWKAKKSGHWNHYAHQAIGEYLSDELIQY